MLRSITALVCLTALLPGCAAEPAPVDLGEFPQATKTDRVEVDVPFTVGPGQEVRFDLQTVGLLQVDTVQDGTDARLQLVAESTDFRRRSWRGRAPFIRLPGNQSSGLLTDYELSLLNHSDVTATGVLHVLTEAPFERGVTAVYNHPDCSGCERPAGEMRRTVLAAIQDANVSIDVCVYAIDDPAIIESLCEAVGIGIPVRIVTDAAEIDRGSDYARAAQELVDCGVQVELTRYGAIMHNKYYVIDAGTDVPVVITGSANQTTADFDVNHNNSFVIRGVPEMADQYAAEFEQLFTHCSASGCDECTPGCTQDVSDEGPFTVGDATIELYFSPSDDALVALRGEILAERLDAPDPACGPDGDCLCWMSGRTYRCDYCGVGELGYGLIGEAETRIYASLFSATDACFALGVAHAAARGVDTLLIFDKVTAGSPYSFDERACEMGVPTMLTEWADGSAQARNHHKLVVVDDAVMTGSMNLSESGSDRNHENTVLIRESRLAEQAFNFIDSEAALLRAAGVVPDC